MAVSVLAYNLTPVMNIVGTKPMMSAIARRNYFARRSHRLWNGDRGRKHFYSGHSRKHVCRWQSLPGNFEWGF
jgi:hypothetical protein